MLKGFPSLGSGCPPLREVAVLPRIRRFYLRVRLDCDTILRREDVTQAFSGVEELVIDVWQAMFLGADHSALKIFEGVRNVKNPRITGSTTGFHDYARWLEDVMKGEVESPVETSEEN
ncbi:hypothetical protein F5X68DRAFT_208402 [Plectosphaerella plurivora]|uniref:Uncharacterized protein n=1 Tax=Plectosphaerella plurivora TaxID=936078 RepID=A0A9P8V8M3_9PEZI|nr:hypothetical protein F5X68DRAFT_208402 [Plectosphaerella plurivora]